MVKIPPEEIEKYRDITIDEWQPHILGHDISTVAGFGPPGFWNMETAVEYQSGRKIPANGRRMIVTVPKSIPLLNGIDQITKQLTPANSRLKHAQIAEFANIIWNSSDDIRFRVIGMAAPSLQYGARWLKANQNDIGMLISLIEPGEPTLLRRELESLADRYFCLTLDDMKGVPLEWLLALLTVGVDSIDRIKHPTRETVIYHCAWGLGRTGMVLSAFALIDYYLALLRTNQDVLRAYVERYKANRFNKNTETHITVLIHGGHTILAMPGTALAIRKVRGLENKWIPACEVTKQVRILEKLEIVILFSLWAYFRAFCVQTGPTKG